MHTTKLYILPFTFFLLITTLTHSITIITAATIPCTYIATDGSEYDVSGLQLADGEYTYLANAAIYKINVCADLPTPCDGVTQASCKIAEYLFFCCCCCGGGCDGVTQASCKIAAYLFFPNNHNPQCKQHPQL